MNQLWMCLCVATVWLSAGASALPEQPRVIREDWEWNDDSKWERMPFSCHIELAPKEAQRPGSLRLTYSITAEAVAGTHLYNPFLDLRKEPQTCVFLIFDENKQFLGRGNVATAGSFMYPSPRDWLYLPHGATIKYQTSLAISEKVYHPRAAALPAGKYYLQLAFDQNTVLQPPTEDRKDPIWQEFLDKMRSRPAKHDYVRSNAIPFEVE
jgi:hypothetical protein